VSGSEELQRLSCEELVALVLQLQAANVALEQANVALEQRMRQLERLVSRNSGNSSMPPSSDDLPGRTRPASKPTNQGEQGTKGTKRKRGKQPGAKGAAMPWVSDPNARVPHRPQGCCGCGSDLAGAAVVGIEHSHQVHDLPQVALQVTQHDVYRVRCGCGTEYVGALPGEVSAAPSSYGPNLKALAVYLLIYQHVPVQRCVQLIADLCGGAGPSPGFVHGMLARCAAAVADVITAIKTLVMMSYVVGFDETTLRVGAAGQKKQYVLSASTELATVYHLGGRDLDSFSAAGILADFAGIAVHDRYVNYFHPRWEHLAGHQVCLAHLLRDFTDAEQTYPQAHWPAQAQRALRGLIRAWHTARDTGLARIDPAACDPLITEFRNAIRVGLAQVPRTPGPRRTTAQPTGRDLLEFCRDHEIDVLRFSTDTRIWPTNNLSERDLRPTKTQQKISGRLTSEDTTQDRLDIRSYIDTARKHGIDILTAIRQALTGNPWTPPLPAPT
jgi:transposase